MSAFIVYGIPLLAIVIALVAYLVLRKLGQHVNSGQS